MLVRIRRVVLLETPAVDRDMLLRVSQMELETDCLSL